MGVPELTTISWFGPQILTALGVGGLGVLLSLLSFRYTMKRDRKRDQWEEFKETIYDPMNRSLDVFQEVARSGLLRTDFSNKDDLHQYLAYLSETMNAVENICGRADKHPDVTLKGWEAFSEEQARNVHSVISQVFIANGQNWAFGNDAPEFRRSLERYTRAFQERLRDERKSFHEVVPHSWTVWRRS